MTEKADAPISRRNGLQLGAASLVASLLPLADATKAASRPPKENAMTDNTAIRPFSHRLSGSRTDRTAPPHHHDALAGSANWSRIRRRACSSRPTQKLAKYWSTEYDWRKCEARLKALPHFITEIDGLDIHFIHVRSKHEKCAAAHRPRMVGPARSSSR